MDSGGQYLHFRAQVYEEEDLYVAICPELDVSSFGADIQEAKESLREAVGAFMEGCRQLGTLQEVLREAGFRLKDDTWLARERVAEEILVAAT